MRNHRSTPQTHIEARLEAPVEAPLGARGATVLVVAFVAMAAMAALLVSCSDGPDTNTPDPLPTTTLDVGGTAVTVELATDGPSRQRGLMYRDGLVKNHGMLFVFPRTERARFWMKNTRIPLDIAFLTARGRIVEIHRREPFDEDSQGPDEAVKYVLEMTQGWFAAHGVEPGATIVIPPEYAHAVR